MKHTKTVRKLSLKRETMRTLTRADLSKVDGAALLSITISINSNCPACRKNRAY